MVKAKAKLEVEEPTRRSARVAKIEHAKAPARKGKRKHDDANAPAAKRTKVGPFNALPQPGLSHLNLPFTFELPPATKNTPSLYVFGTNGEGQLGIGLPEDDEDEYREPLLVENVDKLQPSLGKRGLEDIEAAFGMHSLAIASTGKIWSWGSNDGGALGRTTEGEKAKEKEAEPGLVEGLPAAYRATRVYGSDVASVALSSEGLLYVWGQYRSAEGEIPFDGVSGHPTRQPLPHLPAALAKVKFVAVAAGANHFLGLDVDGEVWTWGSNLEHVLGREVRGRSALSAGLTPRKIHLRHIAAVAACMYTSFAIDKDGKVYAWGSNAFSQTGIEDEEAIEHPTVVDALLPENLNGAKVIQIGGGEHHALFLLDNGSVYACGRCDDYQVGLQKAHPAMEAAVRANKEASAELKRRYAEELAKLMERVAAGEELKPEPEVQAMEIANAEVPVPRVAITEPTRITFPEEEGGEEPRIVQVAVGTRQNLAVSVSGHVYSFGTGVGGQLGQGDPEVVSKPRRIKGEIEDLRVIKAAAGGTHCMLLAVSRDEPVEPQKAAKKEPKGMAPEQINATLVVKASPEGKSTGGRKTASPEGKSPKGKSPNGKATEATHGEVDELVEGAMEVDEEEQEAEALIVKPAKGRAKRKA